MARNSEKRLSGLNRFLEAKDAEKTAKLQRPPLSRLTTADEVKGWIPSIENEIRYLLRQIEGTGSRKHNDTKVQEFQDRIDYLQREHKRFVAKVRSLDPSYSDVVPWQPRGYRRKRERGGGDGVLPPPPTITTGEVIGPQVKKKLYSPLLEHEEKVESVSEKPQSSSESKECYFSQFEANETHDTAQQTKETSSDGVRGGGLLGLDSDGVREGGLLGLDYSSSEDETS